MENFKTIQNIRKAFLETNKNCDHVVVEGNSNILISAPHGVPQTRLGKVKIAEIGSLAMALMLKKHTNCFLIAKTKNNFDDANFDQKTSYKSDLADLIERKNIKYVLDFYGLSSKRQCDVNLGTHIGKNIEVSPKLFDNLCHLLRNAGFKLEIDNPFMGGQNTIAGSMKNKFKNLWTIQIEINSSITNKASNYEKFKTLFETLTKFIDLIKKN